MEENKYYTPNENELFEAIIAGEDIYHEGEISAGIRYKICFYHLDSASRRIQWFYSICSKQDELFIVRPEEFELKYLDKEDIESLGFKYDENYVDFPELGFLKDTNYLSPYTQYLLYYNPVTKKFRIERIINCGTDLDDYLFNGTIKNKSELIKLMKQLGIQ
jgi:hypothetical protein